MLMIIWKLVYKLLGMIPTMTYQTVQRTIIMCINQYKGFLGLKIQRI